MLHVMALGGGISLQSVQRENTTLKRKLVTRARRGCGSLEKEIGALQPKLEEKAKEAQDLLN